MEGAEEPSSRPEIDATQTHRSDPRCVFYPSIEARTAIAENTGAMSVAEQRADERMLWFASTTGEGTDNFEAVCCASFVSHSVVDIAFTGTPHSIADIPFARGFGTPLASQAITRHGLRKSHYRYCCVENLKKSVSTDFPPPSHT